MMIHNYDGGGGCSQTEVGSGADGALDGGPATATVTADDDDDDNNGVGWRVAGGLPVAATKGGGSGGEV